MPGLGTTIPMIVISARSVPPYRDSISLTHLFFATNAFSVRRDLRTIVTGIPCGGRKSAVGDGRFHKIFRFDFFLQLCDRSLGFLALRSQLLQ